MRILLKTFLLSTCLVAFCNTAVADIVDLRDLQPGSIVSFEGEYKDGSTFAATLTIPANGRTRFVVPNQANLRRFKHRVVVNVGGIAEVGINPLPDDISLVSFEPFELPTFVRPEPNILLSYNFDLPTFLSEGNVFSVGQVFTVTAGLIPQTAAIFFMNEFGDPYTGTVTVQTFSRYEAVPEPATVLLLGTGLLGVAMKVRKRLRK